MKSVMTLVFVSLAAVAALGVYTVVSYQRSAQDMLGMNDRMQGLERQIHAQSDQIKELSDLIRRRSDSMASGAPGEGIQTVTNRLNQLEQQVREVASKTAEPQKVPSAAAATDDSKQIAQMTEDTVKKVLKEREQARAEQFKQEMQAEGAEFVAKKITTMTEAQKQAIAPIVGDHAFKLAEMWWLGTAVDEQGKPLSSEERVKRSDQLRIELNEKVRAQLTPSQQAELQSWITERKDKKAKNERVDGDGVFSWLFY